MVPLVEIFWRFLALGCASFGGPAAHLGYFRSTFVEKLRWLDDEAYAGLVALGQFLPGPGSSQVGFALGCRLAGPLGGLAAFLGFTLPSFLLMLGLSLAGESLASWSGFDGVVQGLKLLAVVVVAHATSGMFASFCRRWPSRLLCLGTAFTLLLQPGAWTQLLALGVAALAASLWPGFAPAKTATPVVQAGYSAGKARPRLLWLGLFALLLIALPWLATEGLAPAPFAGFYQAGALVFGGGHVVLPLLQELVGESLSEDRFLFGYAAAQAVPGPMFSLAAFLGAELAPPGAGVSQATLSAFLATAGIFLPGFLLVLGLQGAWTALAARGRVVAAVAGINAAVVGLLLAALYRPVWTSAVTSWLDLVAVSLGFLALRRFKIPILWLVLGFAAFGLLFEV